MLQGVKLVHNTSASVIITNQSLVLQNVGRSMAGNISCLAYNSEGQAESQSVYLDVKCKCFFFNPLSFSFLYLGFVSMIDVNETLHHPLNPNPNRYARL